MSGSVSGMLPPEREVGVDRGEIMGDESRTRSRVEIIVRFREGGALGVEGNRVVAPELRLDGVQRILSGILELRLRRSFPGEPWWIRDLRSRASRRLGPRVPSLDRFVRISLAPDADVEGLVLALREDPAVAGAGRAGILRPACPGNGDASHPDPLAERSEGGVGARWIWDTKGGDGKDLRFCVCDGGFRDSHEDLPRVLVILNPDDRLDVEALHGTRALGVVVARRDGQGVTGFAPAAKAHFASPSTEGPDESGGWRLVQALAAAMRILEPGDVLLIERQVAENGSLRPAEYDADVHAAILTAVGLGIVVVEPAGNGGQDLAGLTNSEGRAIWARADDDDSGAILVGAGWAPGTDHHLGAGDGGGGAGSSLCLPG